MEKIRLSLTRWTHGGSSRTILFSMKRIPKDPPKISTFDDSELRLAQKVHEDINHKGSTDASNAMSSRGGMENYDSSV